jgi:hypothetical protein
MGSIMDQERPWEREKRLAEWNSLSTPRLEKMAEDIKHLSWERVEYNQIMDILKKRSL